MLDFGAVNPKTTPQKLTAKASPKMKLRLEEAELSFSNGSFPGANFFHFPGGGLMMQRSSSSVRNFWVARKIWIIKPEDPTGRDYLKSQKRPILDSNCLWWHDSFVSDGKLICLFVCRGILFEKALQFWMHQKQSPYCWWLKSHSQPPFGCMKPDK